MGHAHYRLGITIRGMFEVLKRIGFIVAKSEASSADMLSMDSAWLYTADYERLDEHSWLDAEFGPIRSGGPYGREGIIGYDVCFYIRRWLEGNGFEKMSLCEVVLLQPEFEDLRDQIGLAEVLWSHLQLEALLGPCSTLRSTQHTETVAGKYIWIDYMCLR